MCPMVTPGVPTIPHVGGPLLPPGVPTVLIAGQPAAVMGNMAVCTGPPDTVVLGSTGVFIGGRPAARMGDMCGHGGTIAVGCPTVLIGEVSGGAPPVVVVTPAGAVTVNNAAGALQQMQKKVLKNAAQRGTPFCEKCAKAKALATQVGNRPGWVEFTLVDPDNQPIANERFKIEMPDGAYAFGVTNDQGKVRIEGFDPGTCKVTFPDKDASEWKRA